jgi:O-antigen ligase
MLARLHLGLLAALVVGLAASITLAQTALVLLALLLLVRPRPAGPGPGWPLLGPLVAFAGWSVVAALASARPLESLVAAKSLLSLGAFWVVLRALPDAAAARRFAAALFVAVGVVAALAVLQVVACPGPYVEGGWFLRKCTRARGFYSIYMTLAGVLTVVLVAALPLVARARGRQLWAVPAWGVGLTALGLTYVRGAWLGFAAGVVGVVLAARRRALAAGALAALGLAALLVPGVSERLQTIGRFEDDTTRERLAMLDAGLRMVRDHPLTGVGVGQVKHLYPGYAGPEARRRSTSHLHDAPLQILVERGVPGLAAWLAIWVAFFAGAARARARAARPDDRALVLGSMAGVGAFLAAGLFEHNFGDTEVLLVTCAVMALPFVVLRDPAALAPGPEASSPDTAPSAGGCAGSAA